MDMVRKERIHEAAKRAAKNAAVARSWNHFYRCRAFVRRPTKKRRPLRIIPGGITFVDVEEGSGGVSVSGETIPDEMLPMTIGEPRVQE